MSFRFLKTGVSRIERKVLEREVGEVSVGKVSNVPLGTSVRREVARDERLDGLRARRAMARFPWEER